MKSTFTKVNGRTRNKARPLTKIDKRVSKKKNNHTTAIKTFDQPPNEPKTPEIGKRSTMYKKKMDCE